MSIEKQEIQTLIYSWIEKIKSLADEGYEIGDMVGKMNISCIKTDPPEFAVINPVSGDFCDDPFSVSVDNPNGYSWGYHVGDSATVNNVAYGDSLALSTANPQTITLSNLPATQTTVYLWVVYMDSAGDIVPLPVIGLQCNSTEFDCDCENATFTETLIPDSAGILDHFYSRRSVLNADETLMHFPRGTGNQILNIDGTVFNASPLTEWSSVWSKTNPNIMYGVPNGSSNFVAWDVTTNTIVNTIYTGSSALTIGTYEGTPDNADCKVVLVDNTDMILLDMKTGTVISTLPKASNHNWAGVSASGNYIVVVNFQSSNAGAGKDMIVYDLNFNEIGRRTGAEHGDFKLIGGVDYYVMESSNDAPRALRLSDLAEFPLAGPGEIMYAQASGNGPEGKFYFSAWNNVTIPGVSDGSIIQIDLDAGLTTSTIQNGEVWAVLPNPTSSGYLGQPKASVSASGRYIIAANGKSGTVETYLYERICP